MGSHVGLIGQGGALTRRLCCGDVTVVLLRYRGYCQFVYFLCCLFVVRAGHRSSVETASLYALFCFSLRPCFSMSICQSCFGEAPNCNGTTDDCPWLKDAKDNVAALSKQDGSKISVDRLIPARMLRLFPHGVIHKLSIINSRSRDGQQVDLENKDATIITTAVLNGSATKEEAILELSTRITNLQNSGDEGAAENCKILAIQIGIIQSLNPRSNSS